MSYENLDDSDLLYSVENQNNSILTNHGQLPTTSMHHTPKMVESVTQPDPLRPKEYKTPVINDFSCIERPENSAEPGEDDESWDVFAQELANTSTKQLDSSPNNQPPIFQDHSSSSDVAIAFVPDENLVKMLRKNNKTLQLKVRTLLTERETLIKRLEAYQHKDMHSSTRLTTSQIKKKMETHKQRQVSFQKDQLLTQSIQHPATLTLTQNINLKQMVEVLQDTKSVLVVEQAIKLRETGKKIKQELGRLQALLQNLLESRTKLVEAIRNKTKSHQQSLKRSCNQFAVYRQKAESVIQNCMDRISQLESSLSHTHNKATTKIPIVKTIQRFPVMLASCSRDANQYRHIMAEEIREADEIDAFLLGYEEKYRMLRNIYEEKIHKYIHIFKSLGQAKQSAPGFEFGTLQEQSPELSRLFIKPVYSAYKKVRELQSHFESNSLFSTDQAQGVVSSKADFNTSTNFEPDADTFQEIFEDQQLVSALQHNLSQLGQIIKSNRPKIVEKSRKDPLGFVSSVYYTFTKMLNTNLTNLSRLFRQSRRGRADQKFQLFSGSCTDSLDCLRQSIADVLSEGPQDSKLVASAVKQNESFIKDLLCLHQLVFCVASSL